MVLLIIPIISAQGLPFQVSSQPGTCDIAYPKFMTIQFNSPYKYHLHVYNSSGLLMTNATTSCIFHVYNITGNHIITDNMSFDSNKVDFFYSLPNTLKRGDYTFLISCNDSKIGCFVSEDISITNTGTTLSQAQSYIYILFILVAATLFSFIFYWSVRLPFKNIRNADDEIISINDLKYLKIFLICIDYVMLLWLFGIMKSITWNFIPELGIDGFFYWGYVIMLSCLWPAIVLSLLFALLMFITDKKLQESIVRGIPVK